MPTPSSKIWQLTRINNKWKMTYANFQENHIEERPLTKWETFWLVWIRGRG